MLGGRIHDQIAIPFLLAKNALLIAEDKQIPFVDPLKDLRALHFRVGDFHLNQCDPRIDWLDGRDRGSHFRVDAIRADDEICQCGFSPLKRQFISVIGGCSQRQEMMIPKNGSWLQGIDQEIPQISAIDFRFGRQDFNLRDAQLDDSVFIQDGMGFAFWSGHAPEGFLQASYLERFAP